MKNHIKKVLRKQRTNKHGQRSLLFTRTDGTENTTHAEHVLLSTFRNIVATERSPIAYADFDTWELLKNETGKIMEGVPILDIDRKADPLLHIAIEAIAQVIKERRKRHAKNLRRLQAQKAAPTTATEGGTTNGS